jgi:hypothetical protein
MTAHELATLAIDDAIKAAGDLLSELRDAKSAALRKNYSGARVMLSQAGGTASYLDHHYIRNAADAVGDCK